MHGRAPLHSRIGRTRFGCQTRPILRCVSCAHALPSHPGRRRRAAADDELMEESDRRGVASHFGVAGPKQRPPEPPPGPGFFSWRRRAVTRQHAPTPAPGLVLSDLSLVAVASASWTHPWRAHPQRQPATVASHSSRSRHSPPAGLGGHQKSYEKFRREAQHFCGGAACDLLRTNR